MTTTAEVDDPSSWPLVSTSADLNPPPDLAQREVRVPELRQRFTAQELSRKLLKKYRSIETETPEELLICFSYVNEQGRRVWPDHVKGIRQLEQYGANVIARLLHGAQQVNSVMFDDDPVADAEGNSEPTADDSTD